MSLKTVFLAASFGIALAGAALAGEVAPVQNQSIDLGTVSGDAYYTVQPDGFHVTATFGTGTPLRFQAVLAAGQVLNVSTPRGVGEQPVSVSIRRLDDRLIVTQVPVTN
jgi:hypothetical protein